MGTHTRLSESSAGLVFKSCGFSSARRTTPKSPPQMRRGILLSSPPGRGELRLIPLLNQEGVGGGLLSEGWRAAAGRARTARFRVRRLGAAFARLCTFCSRAKREQAPALQGPYPVP